MATAVKGDPVQVFLNQQLNYQSPDVVDCRNANAVHVAVFASGTSPSATITMLGSNAAGGNYQTLPDPNAVQRLVTASASYEVNVGASFVRVEISDISGTFARGQGYTVYVTPYVSAGSRQRPNWWDRNPVAQHNEVDIGSVAPHGSTIRFSYTVPSGKRALLTNAFLMVIRQTAASGVDQMAARLFLRVSGTTRLLASAIVNDNAVGASHSAAIGQGALLNAGDIITCQTYDLSTGGTAIYQSSVTLTEFDA